MALADRGRCVHGSAFIFACDFSKYLQRSRGGTGGDDQFVRRCSRVFERCGCGRTEVVALSEGEWLTPIRFWLRAGLARADQGAFDTAILRSEHLHRCGQHSDDRGHLKTRALIQPRELQVSIRRPRPLHLVTCLRSANGAVNFWCGATAQVGPASRKISPNSVFRREVIDREVGLRSKHTAI